jgi:CBS domain-containing protein
MFSEEVISMDAESIIEIIREDYEVIDADETISKVIPFLERYEPDSAYALLVKEGKKIIGVIRERDLLRGSIMVNPHETKIKNFAVKTGILRVSDLSVEKVARRFVEDSTPFVIVQLNGKHGLIYINDFLELIKPELKKFRVREVMSPEVITVKRFDSAAKALATMRNNGIDRVVVVDENNRIAGIITVKDIVDRIISPRKKARMGDGSGEKEKTLSIMVESVMSYPVITAESKESLADVVDMMIKNRISSVVIARDGIPEGIVIKKDILESLIRRSLPLDYDIQIVTSEIELDDFDKDAIADDIRKFMRKFREFFKNALVSLYIKRHKENFRGLPLIFVRIKLTTDKKTFFVSGESWGVEFAVHATLKKLEREVLKEKELLLDRRMQQKVYEEFFE